LTDKQTNHQDHTKSNERRRVDSMQSIVSTAHCRLEFTLNNVINTVYKYKQFTMQVIRTKCISLQCFDPVGWATGRTSCL